jgi:hypothetical protein
MSAPSRMGLYPRRERVPKRTAASLGRRPLTTEIHWKYDRSDPSPRVLNMIKRSSISVRWSLRARNCRVWKLSAVALLFLLNGNRASNAAGCHAQDRPVLKHALSWENDPVTETANAPFALAPRVLTHRPCDGEIPRASSSLTTPATAISVDSSILAPLNNSERLLAPTLTNHSQPVAFRVDRPPRPV